MVFETEREVPVEKRIEVCEVKVEKIRNGFEVFMRSEPIWKFFHGLKGSNNHMEVSDWELSIFNIPDAKVPDNVADVRFNSPGGALMTESCLNATFFRAVKLNEGINIRETFTGLPSNPYGRTLGEAIRRAAQELYTQYISPFEMRILLSSREVMLP